MTRHPVSRILIAIVGVLLLALAARVYWQYSRDIRAARARVSTGSQVIDTRCGPIEFAVAGNGPALLVIHGFAGGFDQGLEIGQPLIARCFRIIAPSRFGYLRTPLPADASQMAQADAHACLLDSLKLDRVAVLGVSAGAPSAMQLCLRHPERCSALVLYVPAVYAPPGAEQPKRSAGGRFLRSALKLSPDFGLWAATKYARVNMVQALLGIPLNDFRNAPPDEQARVLRFLPHGLPVSEREKGMLNDPVTSSLPRYDLEHIAMPTLVISAEDDLLVSYASARYTAEHIPRGRFVGYPSGGHLLVGHGEEAAAAVANFLRRASNE